VSAATQTPRSGRPGRPSTGARERILEAAIEVLKADGYAGLTIAKVAARAGESKALIAYHYGSKQGLVAAAGKAVAEEITARVLAAIESARSVEAVVRGLVVEVERIVDDDPRMARIYFDLAAVSVVDPEVKETIRAINEQWRGVVRQLLSAAEDGLAPARSRTTTALLIAAVQGLALERIERGPIRELADARELLVGAIVAA
jgi:TetR/AcrR family transcriptional repressor of bet genes